MYIDDKTMDTKQILEFLTGLACNNNREWFSEHKEEYTRCRDEFEGFTASFIDAMQQVDPMLQGLAPKDCIWRIYRDVRFSPDKRPYKEWFGTFLAAHGGKKSPYGGYYLHIQPERCMFAGGIWCPEPKLLKALRQSIYDNADELEEIMNSPSFRKYFKDFDTEYMLQRVPQGFPADWEHGDWLKRKAFTCSCMFTDEEVEQEDFLRHLVEICKAFKPMNDFLNYTFEELEE